MTDPAIIDHMDGHQFEYYCADLLKRNGYSNVVVTPGSGDQGVDILAERDGTTYAFQCKCYSGKVGNKAVQEAFSGRTYYDRNVAVVLTNNYFTEQARDAARKMNVLLWDRNTLLALDRVAYGQSSTGKKKTGIGFKNIILTVGFCSILKVSLKMGSVMTQIRLSMTHKNKKRKLMEFYDDPGVWIHYTLK